MRLSLLAGLPGLPGLLFTTGAVLPANPLVVPGKSLGNIRLGSAVDSLTWMGPADYGDAAMQKAWPNRESPGSLATRLTCTPAA